MSDKDDFLRLFQESQGKVRLERDADGRIACVVKRVDARQAEVLNQIQALNCDSLPTILSIEPRDGFLEVREAYIEGQTLEALFEKRGPLSDAALIEIASSSPSSACKTVSRASTNTSSATKAS